MDNREYIGISHACPKKYRPARGADTSDIPASLTGSDPGMSESLTIITRWREYLPTFKPCGVSGLTTSFGTRFNACDAYSYRTSTEWGDGKRHSSTASEVERGARHQRRRVTPL